MLNPDGLITLDKKVQLKPYTARTPVPYELMSDEEIIKGSGGTLIVDSESYNNYFLIAFKHTLTNKIIKLEAPFNPMFLFWIMHNYRTVGFNSIVYDLPMIWASRKNQDTSRLQDISWQLVSGVHIKEIVREFEFTVFKTNHIDIINVCPHHGSLKLYGARIHQPRLQDLPFDCKIDITEEQKEIVADYCIGADLNVTHALFDFMKDRIELREAMGVDYQTDLRSKSDAQIAEAVINKEVQKLIGLWPKRPIIEPGSSYSYNVPDYVSYKLPVLQNMLETVRNAKFVVGHYGVDIPPEISNLNVQMGNSIYRMGVGGLHSYEKNVAYKATDDISIVDRDVASYYPRIILNQRLYPDHIGEAFLTVYNGIVDQRLEAKKANNKTKDKGLKVTINGTFGKSNSIWSTIYSPQMFIQIVMTGQISLLMLIEQITEIGITVISANTDGIVMLCPQYLEGELSNVIANWELQTNFQTEETRYSAYYARDVNAYFAVKSTGEVKVKGPYSEVGSTSATPLDNNPASLICSDAVIALISKGIPIEETIKNCKDIRRMITVRNVKGGAHKEGNYLGKVIRYYYARGIIGTINYILSGNKVPDTDGAKPCMDLPVEFPTDVDYDWYVRKANDILEEIAYKPKTSQLRFF